MREMAETARKLTHDDYVALPDDGKRYELIDGELFEMNAPIMLHQRAIGRLFLDLAPFVQSNGLGEVILSPMDTILSRHNVVQPDLLFVSAAKSGIVVDWVRGAPDLVIEVLSPSNRKHDEVRKLELYERSGVPEYWIADLDVQLVRVYRLVDGRYGRPEVLTAREGDVLRSPQIPGFELPLTKLFR
jgi:Uma2 family endonuclease